MASMGSFLRTAFEEIKKKAAVIISNKQELSALMNIDSRISLYDFIIIEK